MQPICPSECKHILTLLFIGSERYTGRTTGKQRAHASVCKACGTFLVWIDGEQMTFQLVSDEQVEAAGQYARLLTTAER